MELLAFREAATPAGVGDSLDSQDPGLLRTPGYLLQRLRRNTHSAPTEGIHGPRRVGARGLQGELPVASCQLPVACGGDGRFVTAS